MKETLNLLGQKQSFKPADKIRPYIGYVIMGIEQENGQQILATTEEDSLVLDNGRPIKRLPLSIRPDASKRLVDFYANVFHDQQPVAYDCFSFALHITRGKDIEAQEGFLNIDCGASVHTNDLQEGTAYTVVDRNEIGVHALLGSSQPNANLSVIGTKSLLVYMANPTTLDLYNGEYVSTLIDDNEEPFNAQ